MDLLTNLFSPKYYVYWVEILVIIGIVVFLLFLAYSMNLHKKE